MILWRGEPQTSAVRPSADSWTPSQTQLMSCEASTSSPGAKSRVKVFSIILARHVSYRDCSGGISSVVLRLEIRRGACLYQKLFSCQER